MPPEPLPPWDRKEFFRERKHDRSEPIGGSVARWRDSAHHASRDLNRWGSSDFRRTPGHGKQGAWHFFTEESQHNYSSSRSGEDENFRPFTRGEGRYGRNNNRDNRGPYNQREWRGHGWETNSGFSNTPVRSSHDVGNEHKAREDVQSYSSHSNGGFGNTTWDQIHRPKDQQDKMSGSNDATGLNDWKPIKRGSGFSHLSSSKSVGAVEPSEPKVVSEPKNATPILPKVESNACATSFAAASDETSSRKKPRLGWGEGLAKYEKKKVDVPEAPSCSKEGAGTSAASGDVENCHPSSVDKSPRLMSLSDCGSPATPSSVACSSSPGLEEKPFGNAVNIDNDIHNLCGSPGPLSRNHCEELSFNLEKLDSNSGDNFAALLYDLMRTNDSNSADSNYMRATALNKVLILKGNISKNLEITESEIDLLETELKSLNSIVGGSAPSTPGSLPLLQDNVKSCNEQGDAKVLLSRPPPLQILSSGDAAMEKSPARSRGQAEIVANNKDVDVDSPGTATSKFVEPLSVVKPVSSDATHHAAADPMDVCSTFKEVKELKHYSGAVKSGVSAPEVGEKISADNSSFVLGPGNKMSHDVIFSTNKELAKEAHKVLDKLLPRRECKSKISSIGNASLSQHSASTKENFAARKRFLKFKERVITLKFKAFQHLWKEDMRLLSIRKQRAKSHKKLELSMRSLHNGYQKHRSSIRSRFSSPAGSISLVPTTEIINFTKKLLEESQAKLYRDTLKMPALILDKREKIASRFISNNSLVEDPFAVEKARAIMNPWTPAEKEIFMDKFSVLGKDFKKIATFLDHKTTADCVDFYYKNHKSDCFEKKKKLDVSKLEKSCTNSNYLMTLGKRWNRERNSASLDILGAASVIASNADSSTRNRHGSSRRLTLGGYGQSKAAWRDNAIAERSSSFDFAGNERETAAADVLAGICGSLSSEAMSSCITSSADPGESYQDWKCQRSSTFRRPFTPDVMQNGDDETCSDESCGEMDSTDWTDEEKSVFVQAVSSYGRDFSRISRCVRTRSRDQCKVFFSKARKCLGLDLMHPEPGSERMSVGGGGNGSGSGSDNLCALEVGSGACSDKSGSKMDDELPLKMSHALSDPAETVTSQMPLIGSNMKNEEPVDRNVGGSEPHESDGSQSWGRPNAVSEGDSNVVVGVDDQSEMILVNESESVLVSLDSGRKDPTEVGAESESTCAEPVKPVLTVDAYPVTDEMEVDEKRNASGSSLWDLKSAGFVSQLAADSSRSDFPLNGGYQHHPVSLNTVPAKRENSVDFQSSTGGCRVSTVFRDESREHLTGLPLLTNAESSQVVLGGFPSQIPIQKEMMNGVLSCRNLDAAPSLLASDRGNSADPFTSHAYYLQKCTTASKPPCSVAEFPLVSRKVEQAMMERSKAHTRSLSDSENSSSRSGGNVKLFGKILSNPSSGQKANGNQFEQEREAKGSLTQQHQHQHQHNHNHKLGNKSSTNLRFSNLHNPDGAVLKFDPSSYLGLENVQMRSYAYWDGTRLQATFPSIPDSAILLAKYPNAFTNFTAAPSGKLDHTADLGSVFPAREIGGSEGLVDFRRGNGGKVQPYTVGMREALAGFQHPGRGVVGVNMVGRGGIVSGGVSDPVAALKLHFAKTAESRGEEGTRGT